MKAEANGDDRAVRSARRMIDRCAVGREFGPYRGVVEAGRLRLFADAIGEEHPRHFDLVAAQSAGYANIVAPLTYAFCLMFLDTAEPFAYLTELGVDLSRILHGEQSFTYHRPLVAGDELTFSLRITEIYDRKDGTLEFVRDVASGRDRDGALVVELERLIVARSA